MTAVPGVGRVSVVVPCYNARAYVGAALESILAQTQPPEEIIVVDDGSTDDSAAEIARFKQQVLYIRQDNQGIAGARNRGIALAGGSLIGFLDADDLWPQRSLSSRLSALQADSTVAASFGLIEQFADAGCPPGALPPIQPGRLIGAMLIRRSLFDKIGAFDTNLKVGETMDWIARLDAAGARSVIVNELVLRRRVHASNTVRTEAGLHADYLKLLRAAIARRRAGAPSR